MPTKYLTATEAADRLRVHPQTIRTMLRTGDLTGTQRKKGTPWLVSEAALENYGRKYTR